MFTQWLPWKFLVRQAARRHGFIDPIQVMARLRRFAQPADVNEPIELLRAGVVFHARGAINSRAIQHNLDWVWPFWVERQFDPRDPSFVPRAFSLTHINLTHRNWTAVGVPDCWALPIVDPAGLVTPLWDGWSIDCWVLDEQGHRLCPSEQRDSAQRMELDGNPVIITTTERDGLALDVRVSVTLERGTPLCQVTATGSADRPAWLAIALRPYNPEGVSFIHQLRHDPATRTWIVNGRDRVTLELEPERHAMACYRQGDVILGLPQAAREAAPAGEVTCDVGMASAAALFAIEADRSRTITAWAGLAADLVDAPWQAPANHTAEHAWAVSLEHHTRLEIPDSRLQFLYDSAVRTLVLHSPGFENGKGDAFPGPYTYKRFWFRDAAFMLHGLLCINLPGRARRVLERFAERQTAAGYFYSQDGEWDSNGEALWILRRYCELGGEPPAPHWRPMIENAGRWIMRKRKGGHAGKRHPGLFPPGFSAEHLGHIDYYYWDDFWGVAGLRAAAWLLRRLDATTSALEFELDADQFEREIDRTLRTAAERLHRLAMPAAPDRRLDAGAIGSLVAGYPLQLFPPEDPRLRDLIAFLNERCMVERGFFQDMIHSGINAYLTLHMAQVLLRSGESGRAWELIHRVAQLATPTGQWPEAIHPHTLGGCMGDGQHAWAAAEWIVMLRNCFVREEGDSLVLGSGLPPSWLTPGKRLRLAPAPTTFGAVSLTVTCAEDDIHFQVRGNWHDAAPCLRIEVPGFTALRNETGDTEFVLRRVSSGAVSPIHLRAEPEHEEPNTLTLNDPMEFAKVDAKNVNLIP